MKRSIVNVENLLEQLSEEKINRVVDQQVIKAGCSSDEGSNSEGSEGSERSNPGLHLGLGHNK
jgi:hypothetical protein